MPGGSTKKICPFCQVILFCAQKICPNCKKEQPVKQRLKKKLQRFDEKREEWVFGHKKNHNIAPVKDEAIVILEKLHAIGYKPILLLGKKTKKKGNKCEILTPRCTLSTCAQDYLQKIRSFYEYLCEGWNQDFSGNDDQLVEQMSITEGQVEQMSTTEGHAEQATIMEGQAEQMSTTVGQVEQATIMEGQVEQINTMEGQGSAMDTVDLICKKKKSGQPAYEMFDTHPDWAPSLHLGHNEVKPSNKNRFARQLRRQKSRVRTREKVENRVGSEAEEKETQKDVHVQQNEIHNKEKEAAAGHEDHMPQNSHDHSVEKSELCQELDKCKITADWFKDNDGKVQHYTGLSSFAIFQVLLGQIMPFLPQERELTPFQMILLTFMRLKLDLSVQYIANLFSVHQATVSAAFKDTVSVLYSCLSPLVHWPDRESLRDSMPHQVVKIFGNCVAAIVDCFDIFIERPSNLQAKAQTFPNVQHSHTVKYLICFNPQGLISFISNGWPGCTSDKQITENCGFLNKLLPGDIVLATQGYDMKTSVGLMCAEVKTPAASKNQHQLQAKDIKQTRHIAHLRIHVERIIGVVRNKYKIMSSTIPVSMTLPCENENVTFLDKIVTVCCALTNICPGVVQ